MSEYNKELCEERQKNRDNELRSIHQVIGQHDDKLCKLEDAVLILTTLAKNERMWKWVVLALTAVIVALVLGKELAAIVIAQAIP